MSLPYIREQMAIQAKLVEHDESSETKEEEMHKHILIIIAIKI